MNLEKHQAIGWITLPAIGLPVTSPAIPSIWEPDFGYEYVLVIVKVENEPPATFEYNSKETFLETSDERKENSIAVIPGLTENYRIVQGMKVPMAIVVEKIMFEQNEDCYGLIFCTSKNEKPKNLLLDGIRFSINQLQSLTGKVVDLVGKVKVVSDYSSPMSTWVPYSSRFQSLSGFQFFNNPTSEGIKAFGARCGYTIVVIQIPKSVSKVDSEEIEAYLNDGTTLSAAGILFQLISSDNPNSPDVILIDKMVIESNGELQFKPNASGKRLHDSSGSVHGPFTVDYCFDKYLTHHEKKYVVAFDKILQWNSISKIQIGNYFATTSGAAEAN